MEWRPEASFSTQIYIYIFFFVGLNKQTYLQQNKIPSWRVFSNWVANKNITYGLEFLWNSMDFSRTSEGPQRTLSRKWALCWVMVSILFLMLGHQVGDMIYESSWRLKLPFKRSWEMMIWTWSLLGHVTLMNLPNELLIHLCVFF